MEILSASGPDLEKAAAVLSAGGLVAFPTETVYGLGADAFSLSGLAQIFEAKNRPRFDPLIIHIAERGALSGIADTSSLSRTAREKLSILSEKLWPGPLTLVLPKRPEVPDLATAGLPTVAVRFPSHPVAQKLIFLSTGAVAAPSANPFGFLSPTRAEHVKTQLGEIIDIIVDGGKTSLGLESTVLDISGELPMLLRPGGTPKETIEALIGPVGLSSGPSPETGIGGAVPLSPGQMKSHYAPRTPLVLYRPGTLALLPDAADEGRLYFALPGREKETARDRTRVLSETGDLAEAAANFFDMLHELDSLGLKLIWAEEAPGFGLGLAINDRLRRAESGRQWLERADSCY